MGFLDIFFPKRCVACHKIGDYLCKEDRKKIKTANTFCPVCARSGVGGMTHPKCQTRFSLDGLICIFYFASPIKELIHEIKYRLSWDSVKIFRGLLRNQKVLDGVDWTDFEILPLPLHKSKSNLRGFNQSQLLGQVLARELKLNINNSLLIKPSQTRDQAKLKKKEREKQMKGVFHVRDSSLVKNRKFIIFDDVWTTGATLKEAAKTLKRAGSEKVWAIVMASSHNT